MPRWSHKPLTAKRVSSILTPATKKEMKKFVSFSCLCQKFFVYLHHYFIKILANMANDLMEGKFGQLLKRSNKQLREDRGRKIVNTTEKLYRRKVEDLQDELENLQIDRDNLLDINPGNTQTIINPTDFKSQQFVERDMALGISIRETLIKLEVAKQSYSALFGTSEMGTVESDETVE